MSAGRNQLVRLQTEEIASLLHGIPVLQVTWAKDSRLAPSTLATPSPKALRAVQANLARRPETFHQSLAWSAVAAFTAEEGLDTIKSAPATQEDADRVIAGVIHGLSVDLGALVLQVVADSGLPIAHLFLEAESEFRQNPTQFKSDHPHSPVATALSRGDSSQLEVSLSVSDEDGLADPALPIATDVQEVDDLLEEGPRIAEGLRTLADTIDQGVVPTRDHASFLSDADLWTIKARKVTGDGRSLRDVAEALRSELEARAARLAELETLLETVEALLEKGLEKFASILLREHGFDLLTDLVDAIDEHRGHSTTSVLSAQTGHADLPSDSPINEAPSEALPSSSNSEAVEGVLPFEAEAIDTSRLAKSAEESLESSAQSDREAAPTSGRVVDTVMIAVEPEPELVDQQPDTYATSAAEARSDAEKESDRSEATDEPVAIPATEFAEHPEPSRTADRAEQTIGDLEPQRSSTNQHVRVESAQDIAPAPTDGDLDSATGSADAQSASVGTSTSAGPVQEVLPDDEVAALIMAGRETVALIAERSSGSREVRSKILQLFVGSFGTRADLLIAQEPDILLADLNESDRNADDGRLLFASHARLALELGFAPVGSLDRFRQAAALEGHITEDLAAEVVHLVERGFKRPSGTIELTALPDDWNRLADSVETKLSALQNISITYQRASKIARYLTRTNQLLGAALAQCAELARRHGSGDHPADADWSSIEEAASTLRDSGQRNRLLGQADHAVSSSQQLRNPVVASARERLFSILDEIESLLEEALTLRLRAEGSDASDDPQGMADLVATAQRASTSDVTTIGDAAMQRLIKWLGTDNIGIQTQAPLEQLISDTLLPLFELPRDEEGNVQRQSLTAAEIETLIEGREPHAVVHGYLVQGNLRAAEQVASRSGLRDDAEIEDSLAKASQQLSRQNKDLIADVDQALDRLQSLYDDDLVRRLTQELTALKLPAAGRFDLRFAPLFSIRDQAEARLEELREGLRERARALPGHDDSRRILDLLSSRDEQLAYDYLNLAESGESLPVLLPPSGDDFGEFFPDVVRAAETAKRDRAMDVIADLRARLGAHGAPSDRILNQGLKAWNELVIARHADKMTEARLAQVLRMIGLIPRDENWKKELTKAKHAGYATYAIKASPIDRSYVPSLGTQAHGSYDVTIVWDEASPQRLLQYVDSSRRTEANVILYLKTMSVTQRLELRKLTARAGFDFSPIVVDVPVIAWLSTRAEPGWRLTQRVTLPFTTLNPYTPFAGGEVPEEVFVGREAEQREIIDPTGSMFVYGGRQLGKSALLRRVERGIMRVHNGAPGDFEHGQVAVYLDLKSEGIGESAAPSALWGALGPRLVKTGVLSAGTGDWNADTITAGIHDWLEADEARRLLVLLDEADNFLTLDAKDTGKDGMGGFPVLQRLKGVMERSGRRFKPVFAGLHQVQRFHGLPNTPVVHGGKDIPIGPLSPVDARELVHDPLYALGYEFETPDTLWRLLRLTNYQASLIQIISEALVRHMRSSPLPSDGGRVTVSARDVDDVYAKSEVRDLIAQRFRWTINLDSRYRVIALVTAVRSLESAPGERFPASELHDDCEYFWPAGFARSTLSSTEFLRYLNEMQGLGVLYRQGEEFGLRSPSILGLLGSKETIEGELLEAGEHLDVGYQYNPTMNRRVLEHDPSGVETRSPLPDSELASLLDHSKLNVKIRVVTGTQALGLSLVSKALLRAATERPVRAIEVDALMLDDQISGGSGTAAADAHVLLDLTDVDAHVRKAALTALSSAEEVYATVIIPVELLAEVEVYGWPVVQLRRWSLEALQSWHDSPFRRNDLKETTGGWPQLVEQAFSLHTKGSSIEAALSAIHEKLKDADQAEAFVRSAQVPIDITRTWVAWFASADGDTVSISPALLDDLATAFEADGDQIHSMVSDLHRLDLIDETPEGWMLDRVVALATQRLST